MTASISAIPIVMTLAWRTDKRRLLIGGSLVLLGVLAQPGIAIGARALVDHALAGSSTTMLIWLGFAVASCLVGQLMLSHFGHLWYFELGELTEVELNLMVARAIHRNQPLDAVERPEVADGIDLARADVARIRTTVEAAILLATVALQLLLTCLLLASVSWWLLLLPVAALLPVAMTGASEAPLQRAREDSAYLARRIRVTRDSLSLAAEVKETRLGAATQRLTRVHDQAQTDLAHRMRRGFLSYTLRRSLGQLPFAATLVAAIFWAAHLSAQGRASVGDVILVLVLLTQVGGQVANAIGQLNTVTHASAGLERILNLAGGEPMASGTLAPPVGGLTTGVDLEDLGYTYPGSNSSALKGLNLHIPAGTAVALVGENGAGKSTLIKLLHGLYRPCQGRILIDHTDLADFRPDSWHACSTALFQDFTHFDLTAQESIGVGDVDRIREADAVTAAAGRAGALRLIQEFGGLRTILGNSWRVGRDLSGGQWQSIGLSRALMHEKPLLLTLDEPGHSLDPEAEIAMVEAYEHAARDYARKAGAIAVYVTHRLSSVRGADMIIVLQHGSIQAVGTHDELMSHGGYYHDLYTMQARTYTSEPE